MQDKEQKTSDTKPKKDTLTMAIENNPCGRCRTAGYPTCKCGGGGSGEGGGGTGEDKKEDATLNSNQSASMSNQVKEAIKKFDEAKTTFVQWKLSSDIAIHYETGSLIIESDRMRGNLTFQIKPGLTKDEAEISLQFLKTVKTEFEEFKKQLEEQGVSTKNFTSGQKNTELSIHIPNPKYYDAFIKRLENKNSLPIPNPERESLSSSKEDKKQTFNPTPFTTRLEKKK